MSGRPCPSRDGGVQTRGQRAEVGRDLRRELEADLARRDVSHPTSISAIDSNASAPSATNSWSIATVVGSPRPGDDLGEAREAGHGREARLLAEERGHLEVRVQPRLEPAVGLEQERARPGRPTCATGRRQDRAPGPGPSGARSARARAGRHTSAAVGGACGSPSARQRRDRPPLRHRHGQRPPRPIARHGRPQRLAGQRERVRLPAAVVERDRRQREDVRTRSVEDERLIELDATDRAALGAEPARARRWRRGRAPRRPPRPRRAWDWRPQVPVLIITCLTNV